MFNPKWFSDYGGSQHSMTVKEIHLVQIIKNGRSKSWDEEVVGV